MNINFLNQVVFVTGAASGIGYAQAKLFLEKGAFVYGFDINEEGLKKLSTLYPENFSYYQGSVTNKTDIQLAVQETIQMHKTIHILINTAGILDDFKPSLETSEYLWDDIINTNVKGTYLVTNAILHHMLQKGKGIIINMASIAGLIPGGGGAAYTTAKHAIIGYTKQLTYDYAHKGIRANAIAPGAIETPMNQNDFKNGGEIAKWVANETPARRWAQPEEVAQLTAYIASDHASYMHGNVIPLDGGWLNKG